jgi:hypothetical protein
MKDLLLEQGKNTFTVENHNWRFTETPLEYYGQKIRHTISVFQGEWFLDREIGIPYIPDENVEKNMHRRMIETALQVRIGEIDGVVKFLIFNTRLEKSTRKLIVDFTVQIIGGFTYSHTAEVG